MLPGHRGIEHRLVAEVGSHRAVIVRLHLLALAAALLASLRLRTLAGALLGHLLDLLRPSRLLLLLLPELG